jgi:metal-responsive CopG/Arc/MetJ family transcriptional regulator
MAKIKLDSNLLARAKDASEAAGYSSVEEFVSHIIEKELSKTESNDTDENVADQLRGLGYIE